jgi:hypothetical protein
MLLFLLLLCLSFDSNRHSSSSGSTVERSESIASNSSAKRLAPVAGASASASPLHTSSDQHDSFDNEDYDDDVIEPAALQPIGTCIALYPFDGNESPKFRFCTEAC